MKTFKHFLFLCFLAVLTSCSEDTLVPQSEGNIASGSDSVDYISMTVPDVEIDDATTRSKLVDDGAELKFIWQENDAIGVVPMSGAPLYFPIHAENVQKNTAVFDGGQWALRTDAKYSAFFPYKKDNYVKDAKSITIDYTGQTQGNYMKYDFLASGATQPKDGAVKFTMKRLSAILKIRTVIISGNHVQYFSLAASDPVFGVKGTLDLSGTEPVYTPTVMSKSINTQLVVDKEVTSDEEYFTIYLMIPPADLSGKDLTLYINSDAGTAKEVVFEGKNFEAGKAYYIDTGYTYDSYITNANLIIAAGLGDGTKSISAWAKREQILQVKKIDVSGKHDPTVCDEIGFFRNLEKLSCSSNQITSIDVSNNPALTGLTCAYNELTSLDVSNNPVLTELSCSSNQLTSLDVSNNPELTILGCGSNPLTSLDVSNNPALTILGCYSDQLTSLDVSNNPRLNYLYCYSNQLTSLDISNNSELTKLSCYANQLTSLDVSNNPLLTELSCYANKLTSLDVLNNPLLTHLECYSNQLTSLDVSKNTALNEFRCSSNQLTSLDVSNNMALTYLHCSSNQLTSLDVSNNPALTYLICNNNQLNTFTVTNHSKLQGLDISYNEKLTSLDCSDNALTSLTITGCTALQSLDCNNNRLTSLNISSFFPTLPKYNVFCGNQKNSSGANQTLTLTCNAQDFTTFRETTLRNYNVTLVAN